MGNVPTTNLNAYYATTTPGNTIQSGPIDPALQDIVQTVNDNFALFSNFINPISGELLIPDQTIVTRHLRNLAVTNPKLGPLAVTADKIADGSITLTKLADLVVTAAKIANGTITEPKYADGSVSSRVIANSAIKSTHLDPSLLLPMDISVQAEFDKRGINVQKFGAKGDGITDDTLAIQAAVDYAFGIKANVIFPPGNYVVSSILLKNGLRGLLSWGATLTKKYTEVYSDGMISCPTTSLATQVNNCKIEGFRINMNGISNRGIFIYGSDNEVCGNYIYGLTHEGANGIRVYWDSHRNKIYGNWVMADIAAYGTYASMTCIQVAGKQYNNYAGLDEANDVILGTNTAYDNKVYDNHCEGGTHCISLIQTERTTVSNNTIKGGSHRGIILSPCASYNFITVNYIYDCGSTAIHLAYGSSYNHIIDNVYKKSGKVAVTTGFYGESAIQAYIHCKGNVISGNRIDSYHNYGIYVAIFCDDTTIEGNAINGGLRASIAVESDWSSPLLTDELFGRTNYAAPNNASWTSWDNGKGSHNVKISNNRINTYYVSSSEYGAGIYVGQSKTAVLDGLSIRDNYMKGIQDVSKDLYAYVSDATKFTNATISNNDNVPSQPLRNVFTNLSTKLINYKNNSWNTQTIAITAARIDASNLIDVSYYDNYYVTATPATIAGFKGVVAEGRTLTLRLNTSITLVHSSSFKLKGNANVTTPTTFGDNLIMLFVYISNGWLEISRNF